MSENDLKIANKANLWLIVGLIKALSKQNPGLAWTMTEELSLINIEGMPVDTAIGLEFARKWLWEEITQHTHPG